MSNKHPCGNLSPEPNQSATLQTHGVYRDAPILSIGSIRSTWSISMRRAPATRTPPPPSSKHSPAAHLRPIHTPLRQANPRGIPRHTHFSVRFRSFPYSSVFIVPRPRAFAYPRSHQAAKHTPAVSLRPIHTPLRQANPRGIPRRPFFVRQVRQVRLKRHLPATRTPPQPSRTHTPAHALAR